MKKARFLLKIKNEIKCFFIRDKKVIGKKAMIDEVAKWILWGVAILIGLIAIYFIGQNIFGG